jgi:1,4-alpha-glucan branching enzyme
MAKNNNIKKTITESGNGRIQTFSFAAPTATNVQLVGDFTQWQQKPISMQKGLAGVWYTTVELGPGEHHYRFLVDGQWRDDPQCALHVPNPYGGENAVRQVA